MDFLIDNYIWFLVLFVVIIMTIIGRYAEKTNFGKKGKEKNNKPNKTKKNKRKKDELFFEEEAMEAMNEENDVIKTETSQANNKYDVPTIDAIDGLTTDFIKEDRKIVENAATNDQMVENKISENQENVSNNTVNSNIENSPINSITDTKTLEPQAVSNYVNNETINPQNYDINIASANNTYRETKIDNEIADDEMIKDVIEPEERKVENNNIPLPSIETLAQDQTDEDDVWNF